MNHPRVALLAGGTGGAKLACGLRDLIGERLTVVANTADDIVIYGVHVSPDPDLITYRLANQLDANGYGLAGDSFTRMDQLREGGQEAWFTLGDRDWDVCAERKHGLDGGLRLTEAHALATRDFVTGCDVLPMTDATVETWVRTPEAAVHLQEFLVRMHGNQPIEQFDFCGIEHARPTPQVQAAIEQADLVVIGPSNPVISTGPIVTVPGIADLLRFGSAPVVAVSPFVEDSVLKGPTARCLEAIGHPASPEGAASCFEDVIDAFVCDRPCDLAVDVHVRSVAMPDAEAQRELASALLKLAKPLT